MDFLANENFPLSSVRFLREAGHRVVSIVQEAPGSKDRDILKRAHNERLIILTFDRDYGELIYRFQAYPQQVLFISDLRRPHLWNRPRSSSMSWKEPACPSWVNLRLLKEAESVKDHFIQGN